ncbi:MAG: DNA-directed RNA polymerase subunit omega [SAR324 cluster bacterium]|jgi:DNA-directed RNA polymerase subunit K/omega|nr:DNA-directed RNA polymerase subunit omega [SAR324 cluster bacterium]MEC7887970.1 DNA-directed RNA polymerase subunit omega [SAR324 cluster bacterium]MEC8981047.1 DNA-directed RNA polymerase subunit omega [SAR324 cluster bacterium]MEC9382882.1 DNA-directed RNA polymerase subunit omega [SAR324 cluster bacterium]MED5434866.1 DNA-directed RNA polymerase subunit omega [SAR324 cluster bacterium]
MIDDYLKLVEEHGQEDKSNLFEKVLTLSKRAKSLYSLEESARSSFKHKPTFQAILENNEGSLQIKNTTLDGSAEESRE